MVSSRIQSQANNQEMVGCKLIVTMKKSCWLSELLRTEFFNCCDNHRNYRKNEMNLFCIDCNVGFCRHCSASHCLHRRLQICKYVYQNVVRLQEIQKHFDCSQIQTYKINGEKAVHLNSRPQSKDAKPSTKSFGAGSCKACGRYIQDQPNQFCSIECKISVVPLRHIDQSQDLINVPTPDREDLSPKESYSEMESSLSLAESGEEVHANWVRSALKPKRLLRKRKGKPFRSPLS